MLRRPFGAPSVRRVHGNTRVTFWTLDGASSPSGVGLARKVGQLDYAVGCVGAASLASRKRILSPRLTNPYGIAARTISAASGFMHRIVGLIPSPHGVLAPPSDGHIKPEVGPWTIRTAMP